MPILDSSTERTSTTAVNEVAALRRVARGIGQPEQTTNSGGSASIALRLILVYVAVTLLAVMFCAPLLFALSASLKAPPDVFKVPIQWIPHPLRWGNYRDAFTKLPFLLFVLNTVVLTELVVIGTVLTSSLVAYGFARFSFRGRNLLFGLLISTMLLPGQVTMIPVFLLWNKLGAINTLWPLVIPAFVGSSAFNIFLLRQFYLTLPRSLEEAAIIDGCSPFGIWWRIMLPLSKPALITVGLFAFTGAWADFMGPLIYLQSYDKYTVSIGLQLFNDQYGGTNISLLMAASMLHILPVLILFLVAQKYFIKGIATSGIKE